MCRQISRSALQRLLAAIGGGRDDLDELRSDYLSMAPELVQRLIGAHARGDLETLRITAHELKSNARDFGAEDLADLCEALERRAGRGADIDRGELKKIAAAEENARVLLARLDLSDV